MSCKASGSCLSFIFSPCIVGRNCPYNFDILLSWCLCTLCGTPLIHLLCLPQLPVILSLRGYWWAPRFCLRPLSFCISSLIIYSPLQEPAPVPPMPRLPINPYSLASDVSNSNVRNHLKQAWNQLLLLLGSALGATTIIPELECIKVWLCPFFLPVVTAVNATW